jgi:hypothetical protein
VKTTHFSAVAEMFNNLSTFYCRNILLGRYNNVTRDNDFFIHYLILPEDDPVRIETRSGEIWDCNSIKTFLCIAS